MNEHHLRLGAVLAPDGIPLHYGDLKAEYESALHAAVLMDRSHEGRLILTGRDRLALPQRMSTNDLLSLAAGTGAPTLFTNPNGRILDRATIYAREDDALVLTEAGRGDALRMYLQRNIFFNDDMQIRDMASAARSFALHGPAADQVMAQFDPALAEAPAFAARQVDIGGISITALRGKPVSTALWTLIAPAEAAAAIFDAVLQTGAAFGLRAAGSLTYNALRIRAGRPAPGRELTSDYIPLELGLWDEISFSKGCYTGQEIIARMESRRRLAKTIVTVTLSAPVDAPKALLAEGRNAGTLTSAVETPLGERLGIAVVRVAAARVGVELSTEDGTRAQITALAGVQPHDLIAEETAT